MGGARVRWALGLSRSARVAEDLYGVHSYSVATVLSAMEVETATATEERWLWVWIVARILRGETQRRRDLPLARHPCRDPRFADRLGELLHPFSCRSRSHDLASPPLVPPVLFISRARLPRPRLFAGELEPGGGCCKPADVPLSSWVINHAPPGLWPAAGHAALAAAIVTIVAWTMARTEADDHDVNADTVRRFERASPKLLIDP